MGLDTNHFESIPDSDSLLDGILPRYQLKQHVRLPLLEIRSLVDTICPNKKELEAESRMATSGGDQMLRVDCEYKGEGEKCLHPEVVSHPEMAERVKRGHGAKCVIEDVRGEVTDTTGKKVVKVDPIVREPGAVLFMAGDNSDVPTY